MFMRVHASKHSVQQPRPFAAAPLYTISPGDAHLTCDAIMLPAVVERAPERHPCSATGSDTACLTVVQENGMQDAYQKASRCCSITRQASLGLRSTPLHPAHHNNRFVSVLEDGLDAVQEVRVW